MSTETQILVLFEEGNPIPDIDQLERLDLDAAAYLATLHTRSSEMTQVDERIDEKSHKRPPNWTLLAAAAVLIIVAGVALILLSGSNEGAPVVTEPAPSPTTVPEATPTTAVPQPTTTLDEAEAAWQAIPVCCAGGGEFRATGFSPEFTFTVGEGWMRESSPFPRYYGIVPADDQSGDVHSGVFLFNLENTTQDEQMLRFENTDLFSIGSQDEVLLDGAPGTRLLITPNEPMTLVDFGQAGFFGVHGGVEHLVYLTEVQGATLLIVGELGEGIDPVESIIQSITFRDVE